MVRELKIGVFGGLNLSDVSIGVLGAMYVGIFVILTVSWLYCEQRRYTFAVDFCFEFGFLVCFRESGFNLKWDKFNWTRLGVDPPIAGERIDVRSQQNDRL